MIFRDETSNKSGEFTLKHTSCLTLFTVLLFNSCGRCFSGVDADSLSAPRQGPIARLEVNETDQTIVVSSGGNLVLAYNKRSPAMPDDVDPIYQRSGFLHPVKSPAGHMVTAVFPLDHPHQDGIFSAWVNTSWCGRKIDFWNLSGGTGRVLHQQVVGTFCDEASAGFEVDLVHRVVEQPVADVLNERWKVTVRLTDSSFHCFDLETTQTALTELPLIINEHRYGGIALRGPTRWLQPGIDRTEKDAAKATTERREAAEFLNDRGSDRIHGNHEKSRWVSLAGHMNGQPVSITVLCHAQNFRAPQTARLHPSKPYFCFAPCVEGEFVIDKDHPFHARYRYLVTDAVPNAPWLNRQWREWCRE